jgi:mono/diheme cytochrome c family protein
MLTRLCITIALTCGPLPCLLAAEPWVAPAAQAAVADPTPDNAATRDQGSAVYAKNCQICHGSSGDGDGTGAAYMNPKPAKLSDSAIQAQSDGALFWKIGKGRNLMPGWTPNFSAADRWAVVRYIRTFAAKGSDDGATLAASATASGATTAGMKH